MGESEADTEVVQKLKKERWRMDQSRTNRVELSNEFFGLLTNLIKHNLAGFKCCDR